MNTLKFDISQNGGEFKLLNATNGGPWHRKGGSQKGLHFTSYKNARIPYSRNHDSAVLPIYGGPYSHDINRLFPYFDADEFDPESYDFECTDDSILATLEAGTQTFFRLGQTIEHQVKKHGTIPPKDFKKWAVICEHIIRHYNEGWHNGFNLNMQYWEIWNEPDLDPEDSTNKRTWGGTKAQFFDFYETAAKHLKKCFPDLKIGGPALAFDRKWAEDFLCEMQKRQVPIDFFSWHIYCVEPEEMLKRATELDALLNKYGYENAERICNEWNYVESWEDFTSTLKAQRNIKGATFVYSCICAAQHMPIDMLMYYDTRLSKFNGVFDYYTGAPIKGYYALYWYGMFYDMEYEIPAQNNIENIYSLCGIDKNGKLLATVTHYSNNDDTPNKKVNIDFGRKGTFEIYSVDENHDGELIATTDNLEFDMPIHSMLLIKEI